VTRRLAKCRVGRVACAVLLAMAWAQPSAGAQPASTSPSATLSGIAHVAIRVGDLERSRAFYRKLGYEEAFAMDAGGSPTEAFFKIDDRQFIELYPRRRPGQAVGFMHVCFEAPDLTALHQDYVDHGLTPTPAKQAGAGNLLFTLQGPDEPGQPAELRPQASQNIEYTQYMPGSRHMLDRGAHLGTSRIANRMVGAAIPVSDSAAAATFYVAKLSFHRAAQPLERGIPAVALPGDPNSFIEFLAARETAANGSLKALPFRILFAVPDLKATRNRLEALGFRAGLHHRAITVEDPDGNQLVFIWLR
jgi:catechol 2,3-dioxygenase-like lactoylglutathione lyase family enzyme